MKYIVKCTKCNQKAIVDIKENETLEKKNCPICKAEGENLEIETSVKEALPSVDLIQKAMGMR